MSETGLMTHEDETGAETTKGTTGPSWKRFVPIAIIVAGLGAAYATGLHEFFTLESLAERREDLRSFVGANLAFAALVYVVGYAAAVAFSFPAASVLTVFSGFLFGWALGGALTAVAATIGASALFLAARSAFGEVLRKKAGPFAVKLADGFKENAFGYLFALRLAPFFPFFIINIVPALFGVPLRTYAAATILGILPGTFAYAFLGEGLDSVITSAAEAGRDAALTDLATPEITIAFAALALVALIPVGVKKWRGRKSA